MSWLPPAATGLMKRTSFEGYGALWPQELCARADSAIPARTNAALFTAGTKGEDDGLRRQTSHESRITSHAFLSGHGRLPAGQRRAPQVARVVLVVEGAGAVHRALVVPHDEVADPPLVAIDELALRRVLGQLAQQHHRFGHRPADDPPGVRGEIERGPAARRVDAHERLAHRGEIALLALRKAKAQRALGKDAAVLGDEALHLRLEIGVQHVPGG